MGGSGQAFFAYICNQAALQRQMGENLKMLTQAQSKGKSPYLRGALDNLNVGFLCKITGHMSGTVSHLSEGFLVNLANATLMRRDAVLGALRPGARKDKVAALHSHPILVSGSCHTTGGTGDERV